MGLLIIQFHDALQLPYIQTKACVKGFFIWYNTTLMLSYQILKK
jgi:hypothetical protein